MSIDGRNRALRRLLGWLSESDLNVIVWKTEDETPILLSVVDSSEEPVHAATLRVLDTTEDGSED